MGRIKKKQILALILAFVLMALTFTSCAASTSTEDQTTDKIISVSESESDKKYEETILDDEILPSSDILFEEEEIVADSIEEPNIETDIDKEEFSDSDILLDESNEIAEELEETGKISVDEQFLFTTESPFTITMLDVGQGLSILIESDGEYAIYDGGGRNTSSYVVSYLQNHGITELKYMFVSHYDEDHIAGLVGVLNTAAVDTVVCPDYETDTNIYASFIDMRDQNGAEVVHPSAGDVYSLGNAAIQVVSQTDKEYSGENDRSIAIRISYGDFSCIITGDAESEAESDMISLGYTLQSDLYVVGHHGSSSSSSSAFVQAINPSYAFISSGKENSYGHPTAQTLNTLQNNGIQIFRSDTQGEVTCYSDGVVYWFSTEPTDNWNAGGSSSNNDSNSSTEISGAGTEESGSVSSSVSSSEEQTYILNTHTMKFHYPTCSSVDDMNAKNKQEYTGNRDDLINQGYSPCGRCNP